MHSRWERYKRLKETPEEKKERWEKSRKRYRKEHKEELSNYFREWYEKNRKVWIREQKLLEEIENLKSENKILKKKIQEWLDYINRHNY